MILSQSIVENVTNIMKTTSIQIPIIDFQPFIYGKNQQKKAVAEQIYSACHETGFMYLQNVGISSQALEVVFAQSKYFFNLPQRVKNQVAWSDALSNRGYTSMELERLSPDKPGDLKETFNLGLEPIKLEDRKENLFNRTNKWPRGEENFRQTTLGFFQVASEAAAHLCHAFALALGLEESFFSEKHHLQYHTLRLLHYPPINFPAKPEQQRAGVHSDYGSFTLLFQDNIGGLEVLSLNKEWIAAPAVRDTVLVNIGDLMQRWTNNRFRSTKHRVTIPRDDRIGQSRYSIALFCHPNDNTEVSCLETCYDDEDPSLYPTISAGNYLLQRLQATY